MENNCEFNALLFYRLDFCYRDQLRIDCGEGSDTSVNLVCINQC